MDEPRKSAYRYLLYWAMLEIRAIAWVRLRGWRMLNPLHWREHTGSVRRAGVIADWLHNLALFSAHDFEGFDEERFWHELKSLNAKYPDYDLMHYRTLFDQHLG